MKTSFVFVFRRRLLSSSSEDVLKMFSRRLHQGYYILLTHMSSEDVFKTSSRCLDQDQYTRLGHTSLSNTSSKRLQDVLKTFWRHLQDVLKTFSKRLQNAFRKSSRRLQDVCKTYHQVKLFLLTCFQDVFKIY